MWVRRGDGRARRRPRSAMRRGERTSQHIERRVIQREGRNTRLGMLFQHTVADDELDVDDTRDRLRADLCSSRHAQLMLLEQDRAAKTHLKQRWWWLRAMRLLNALSRENRHLSQPPLNQRLPAPA